MGFFSKFRKAAKGSNETNQFVIETGGGKTATLEFHAGSITLKSAGEEARPLLKTESGRKSLSFEVSDEAKFQIAQKISRLLPGLVVAKKIELLEYSLYVIKALCKDQVTRVRLIIAEELKDNPAAPHDLIVMLAWDEELEVSSPVLEFSPVLTDDDLIEILAAAKIPGVVECVAKRKHVSSRVSSAITRTHDNKAVALLLDNRGASIDEDSLMRIAGDAIEVEIWQAPLLSRPELSIKVINRIATYISQSLLAQMEESGRLNPQVASELKAAVAKRLSSPSADKSVRSARKARELFDMDILTADEIANAVENNEREFAVAGISLLSGFRTDIVEKILRSQNARAVTALAWKAGLPMRTAVQMQLRFAKIHHKDILNAKDGSDYPISQTRMCEYLELFNS